MKTVNIHTHRLETGISIWNISDVRELKPGVRCSMGIHPWFIGDGTAKLLLEIKEAAKNKWIVAIGEAGLDRNVNIPIEEQMLLLGQQIQLSEEFKIPLIIHCVRAFPELLSLHKQYRPQQAWIIHGFNNNREILKGLLQHGCYISVGKSVMNEQSPIFQLLPEIPLDRLFIENDDSDYEIEMIYNQVTYRLQMDAEKLKEVVYSNFRRLFEIE